jgi:hypothetical protein
MASKVFNEFKRASAAGEIDLNADDIRVALLMSNTTADTANDGISFVSGLTLDECDGANYVRKALASETVTKDDTNDRAEFDAVDVTWSALGNGTRAVQGLLVYKHVTNDADSIPICWVEFSVNQNPGGSDFTVTWNAEGIIQLS